MAALNRISETVDVLLSPAGSEEEVRRKTRPTLFISMISSSLFLSLSLSGPLHVS